MRKTSRLGIAAILVVGLVPISLAASPKVSPEAGKRIYLESCQNCHGPTGKGDSEMAAYLSPAPADLTGKATQSKTDVQLRKIIQEGRPGTAMTGYGASLDEALPSGTTQRANPIWAASFSRSSSPFW